MIGPVIGHLGPRVSDLLDGQLSPAEEERAWEHVHSCHHCRDSVEREGWVKTRLASMQLAGASGAPSHLKGSLLSHGLVDWPELPDHDPTAAHARGRRHLGVAGISGGAVGAAVMGVLALGASPANAPGVLVRPGADSFGTSLSRAVTAFVDQDTGRGPHARRGLGPEVLPLAHSLGRRLAP